MASNLPSDAKARVTQCGYVGLSVSDLPTWTRFAGEVLGLQVNGEGGDGSVFLRMDSYHHRFQLLPTGADDIAFHGWEVKDAQALNQIADQVRAYGIEVTRGTPDEAAQRMVVDLIKFDDPDGLPMEIYYGARVDHMPFVSPRGVQGFKADGLGLGHILLIVKDAEAYVRFFTEVLGARISDYISPAPGMRLTFMHVNPRHHSLAVMQARPGMPAQRLSHFMLEANAMDDVGRARSLFERWGGGVLGEFGRHTNDKMFSFYGTTPSGFFVEYGHDGYLITDEEKWEVTHHTAASMWGHAMPRPTPPAGSKAPA